MNPWRVLSGSNTAHLWRGVDDDVIQIALCNRVRYCVSEEHTVSLTAAPGSKPCKLCERRQREWT